MGRDLVLYRRFKFNMEFIIGRTPMKESVIHLREVLMRHRSLWSTIMVVVLLGMPFPPAVADQEHVTEHLIRFANTHEIARYPIRQDTRAD